MYCPKCGKQNNDDARFCQYCSFDLSGIKIQKTEQPQVEEKSVEQPFEPEAVIYKKPEPKGKPDDGEYAGFLRRVYAFIIDLVLLTFIGIGVYVTLKVTGIVYDAEDSIYRFIMFLSAWLYFAFLESSENQATLGKQTIGIIVTDNKGNKITFLRATGRHFARILSSLPLLIGYLLPIWTKKKQTLHDMLTDTVVVKKNSISDEAVSDILAYSFWFFFLLIFVIIAICG